MTSSSLSSFLETFYAPRNTNLMSELEFVTKQIEDLMLRKQTLKQQMSESKPVLRKMHQTFTSNSLRKTASVQLTPEKDGTITYVYNGNGYDKQSFETMEKAWKQIQLVSKGYVLTKEEQTRFLPSINQVFTCVAVASTIQNEGFDIKVSNTETEIGMTNWAPTIEEARIKIATFIDGVIYMYYSREEREKKQGSAPADTVGDNRMYLTKGKRFWEGRISEDKSTSKPAYLFTIRYGSGTAKGRTTKPTRFETLKDAKAELKQRSMDKQSNGYKA